MNVGENDCLAMRRTKRVPGPGEHVTPERSGRYRVRLKGDLLVDRHVEALQTGDLSNLLYQRGSVRWPRALGEQGVGQPRSEREENSTHQCEPDDSTHGRGA